MALLRIVCAALLILLPGEIRGQRGPAGGGGPVGEYGVKLCGREFIRAVIFTCGGSRWKRLSLDEEDGGERRREGPAYRRRGGTDAMQTSTNKELNQLKSLLGSHMDQAQKSDFPFRQQSLKEYFNMYEDYNDYAPVPEDFDEYVRQRDEAFRKTQSGSDTNTPAESDGYPWSKYPRRRREMSVGVAGICCKWGCTKAEISTLC
ncbi:relaxin-3-like [Discoglossus pictus]